MWAEKSSKRSDAPKNSRKLLLFFQIHSGIFNGGRISGHHHMNNLFKLLLLTSLWLSGQVALATPQADASFIAQRSQDPAWLNSVQKSLKSAFVTVYFRPISGQGIKIANSEKFIELIPDEDIAPYLDRLISRTAEIYLSVYTPEQLASIATVLRADEDATVEEIFSEEYQQRYAAALEQARSNAHSSGSDDPLVIGLEELTVQLNAVSAMLKGGGAERLGQDMALGIGSLFTVMGYSREITKIEREPNNPVTIAAIKADGVLRFANPVQRQTLLRQLSASKNTGGIRFIKPPATSPETN